MTARSSGDTVTPRRDSMARTGSAPAGGRVRFTSMSVVALGLRYQVEGDRPPELVRHAQRSRASRGARRSSGPGCRTAAVSSVPLTDVIDRSPGAARSARRRASGGNRSGSGVVGGRNALTWATRPRRSMRASPGSWRSAGLVGPARANGPSGGRPRRTVPASRGARDAGVTVRAAPARRPARTASGVEGPAAPAGGPRASTSSVSWAKLAKERARGPLGVWTDSRISNRPLGRATT